MQLAFQMPIWSISKELRTAFVKGNEVIEKMNFVPSIRGDTCSFPCPLPLFPMFHLQGHWRNFNSRSCAPCPKSHRRWIRVIDSLSLHLKIWMFPMVLQWITFKHLQRRRLQNGQNTHSLAITLPVHTTCFFITACWRSARRIQVASLYLLHPSLDLCDPLFHAESRVEEHVKGGEGSVL